MKSVVKVAVPVLCLLILIFCCYHHRQTEIVDKHISTYDSTKEQSEPKTEAAIPSFESSVNQTSYVLNMSTKKFHYPYCSSVKQMADKNRRDMNATREEVIAIGYNPCGRCNP